MNYKLLNLVRKNNVIKYIPRRELIYHRLYKGNILNEYYMISVVLQMSELLKSEREFFYIPPKDYIQSRDMNHWIIYNSICFRPHLFDKNLIELYMNGNIVISDDYYPNLIV